MTEATEKRGRLPLMDRLPEHVHYHDQGCEVAPSCLRCPLARCIHDETPAERAAAQQVRDEAIYRLYRQEGRDVKALAERFGVSRRTVHRAVQRLRRRERVQ